MIKVGDRIGSIVVVEPTILRVNNSIVWKCKCDCGNEVLYSTHRLWEKQKQKHTHCSNCRRVKVGEEYLSDISKKMNIPYSTLWGRYSRNEFSTQPKSHPQKRVDVGLGKPYSFTELARMSGVKRTTIIERYKRGVRGNPLLAKVDKRTSIVYNNEEVIL